MQNLMSIETARGALARAAWIRGTSPRYDDTAVVDLLVDLRHLCRSAGIDFAICDRLAANDFDHRAGGAS